MQCSLLLLLFRHEMDGGGSQAQLLIWLGYPFECKVQAVQTRGRLLRIIIATRQRRLLVLLLLATAEQ
jgi:hypothetical protein